jgi:hypothetical protein
MGFFGFSPGSPSRAPGDAGTPPQPLHKARVDIRRALDEVGPVLDLYFEARRMPEVPAFTGGLVSDWPAWASQAWGILRQEDQSVTAYMRSIDG